MFQTTQVIHVKRKRDDAPVDSLFLETSSKRARPNLAPQYYFKRLASSSSASLAWTAAQSATPSTNAANGNNTSTSREHESSITRSSEDEESLKVSRLLAPPSSLLRSSYNSTDGGNYYADPDAAKPPLILDEDGCPRILSGPESEQVRDPYALRQGERVANEHAAAVAAASVVGASDRQLNGSGGGVKRRVVVQRRAGAVDGFGQGTGKVVFSIARDGTNHKPDAAATAAIAANGDRMDVDERTVQAGADDDGDFVYDVFVPAAVNNTKTRAGAAIQWATAKPTGLAGTLLVNDDDADWIGDYFYEGNVLDEDDEDRVYSDDEDSNAEDYYGADYPDDEDEDYNEVDSDDDEYD